MAINFPDIDPVMLYIGPLGIRWYSIAYMVGIILGWYGFKKIQKFSMSKEALDNMLSYAVLGIIIGGRLGYILFYNLKSYLADPISIIKIWEGGMSFHGGLIGFVLAMFIFCKRNNIPFFPILDISACFTPIGLFLGRIANFINGELWGRTTNVPWGVIFPLAGPLPRHPSQIYEALGEGLLLFLIMMFTLFKTNARSYPGLLSGIMLVLYSIVRISLECFRDPGPNLGYLAFGSTLGQWLSLPILIVGVLLILRSHKNTLLIQYR